MRAIPPPLRILVLALSLAAAPAPAQEIDRVRAEAAPKLVADLEALADWCNKSGLTREEHRTLARILVYDPAHKRARGVLKYTLAKDGTWKQAPAYKEPLNKTGRKEPEFPARRGAAAAAFVDAMLVAVQKEPAGSEARTKALDELLLLDPEHAQVRELLGHVKVDGRWMTREESEARGRRRKIAEMAQAALAGVPAPQESSPDSFEQKVVLRWTGILKTDGVRVAGTGDRKLAESIARHAEAAGTFFREVFDNTMRHRYDFAFYVPATEPEAAQILAAASPNGAGDANFKGFAWIPGRNQVVLAGWDPDVLVGWTCRIAFGNLIGDAFDLTAEEQAWASEGLGLYLTAKLSGTHHATWGPVNPADPTKDTARLEAVIASKKDLLDEARTAKITPLRDLAGKALASFTAEDLLGAYAAAAWLVEACPKDAAPILRAIGKKKRPEEAIPERLGIPWEAAEARFRAWLKATP